MGRCLLLVPAAAALALPAPSLAASIDVRVAGNAPGAHVELRRETETDTNAPVVASSSLAHGGVRFGTLTSGTYIATFSLPMRSEAPQSSRSPHPQRGSR